jgi:diguanylate cyclase (GGDEF)-like protein
MAKAPVQTGTVRQPPSPPWEIPEGPALARFLLENPVTLAMLGGLSGHAVLLDRERRLVAASPDALAALGLDPVALASAAFPLPSALNLAVRGLRFSAWPVEMTLAPWELYLFQDVRSDLRHEELAATFFEELLEAVGQLAYLAVHPVAMGQGRKASQNRLGELAQQLHAEVEAQFQALHPGGRALTPLPGPAAPPGPPKPRPGIQDLILVVDDSAMIRRFLEAVLTGEHLRVATAASGTEGLEMAIRCEPDLILLDAVMPDLSGFEVCARLKADERTRDIPVLFVTALREDADEVSALHAGAVDFIPKPIHPATVAARVHNHLELKHSRDQLRRLSFVDGLTGIANRRGFDQSLEKEWNRACRNGKPLSLLMGDVDFFKNYNDRLGHATGDECLRRVARVFEEALHRPGDLAARYGGEEFMCVLPETDREGVRKLAELIMANLAAENLPHPDSAVASRVSISIGLATAHPVPGARPQALIDEVDQSMYQAKHQGRNRYDEAWLPDPIRQ